MKRRAFVAWLPLACMTPPARSFEFPAQLPPAMEAFVMRMVATNGFDEAALRAVFEGVRLQPGVIRALTTPATSKPWKDFRAGQVNRRRVGAGVNFWNDNAATLRAAEREYGVAAEIVVAILGIESQYGRNTGDFRVIDAISTIAFEVPARAAFFEGELEALLLLCRDTGFDPTALRGSYAGAMGWPQFLPSSYRRHAVDFDGDGRTDLWTSRADCIGSVANYLRNYGWRSGADVALRATVTPGPGPGPGLDAAIGAGIKPSLDNDRLRDAGVVPSRPLGAGERAALMLFEGDGGPEYWLGLDNFFVITRYNRSQNYAMAVWQLGREILAASGR